MTSDILAAMAPLPFPCYSWPLPEVRMGITLLDWTRVTHAVSLRGETCTEEEVRYAAEACRQVNRFHPKIPATIAVNWSPYQGATYTPLEWGQQVFKDLGAFCDKLRLIRQWAGDVRVSAVLFDHEKWKVKHEEPWDKELDTKYDAFYWYAELIFPDAAIYLYGRGESGQRLTGNELGDGTSTRLYWPDDGVKQQGLIEGRRRNPAHPDGPLSWWVALGWSRDHFENGQIQPVEYALSNDQVLGATIAENAPHEPVILYPSPFDPRLTDPWDHFAAFAEGAGS